MPPVGRTAPIAMGCMRLSTDPDRDESRAIDVLHAALDAGVTLFDTANAYCHDDSETGHNERLIAAALASWSGDRSHVRIATKGGLTRPEGHWVADGRARALTSACEASLRALDVRRIDLYQLHAPDPRTPFETSMRALESLRRDGLVERIGLCNVTLGQIEQARSLTEIAAVQVELSLWNEAAILSGVAEYCVTHGIQILAYRPLGGPERHRRITTDPLLARLADEHGATPFEIALAALASLAAPIVPLPGPTRVETAQSVARADRIALTDDDQARLAEHFATPRALRLRAAPRPTGELRTDGEVVLIMGLPGAGKSTLARRLVADGYSRINRDETGGSLAGVIKVLDRRIDEGSTRVVLDNTYVSRTSRAAVVQAAWQRGLPVRCIWLSTSIEDAQINAASRILSRYGRLLGGDELRAASRRDPAAFGPTVQFRYQRELEPPDAAEGFSAVDIVDFERTRDPSFTNRALIVWADGVLYRSRSERRFPLTADDLDVVVDRGAMLRRYEAEGWKILGMSWAPDVTEQTMTSADVDGVFARVRERLGVTIDIEHCPHAAGPPTCWCRKPLPGLGVVFVQRHRLDPSQCVYVGSGAQDPGFARKLGVEYRDANDFFA